MHSLCEELGRILAVVMSEICPADERQYSLSLRSRLNQSASVNPPTYLKSILYYNISLFSSATATYQL